MNSNQNSEKENGNRTNAQNDTLTPAALLEQLVYVDTFMPEIDDPSHLDERLAAELSAFADDTFVFPDEDKPKENSSDGNRNNESLMERFDRLNNNFSPPSNALSVNSNSSSGTKSFSTLGNSSFGNNNGTNLLSPLSTFSNTTNASSTLINQGLPQNTSTSPNTSDLLSHLPKVQVPPGAQSSLMAAGLSQTQIDALAALVAQHQGVDGNTQSTGTSISSLSSSNNRSLTNLNQFSLNQNQNQSQISNLNLNQMLSASSLLPSNPRSSLSLGSSSSTNIGFSTSPGSTSVTSFNDKRRDSIKIESTGDVDLDKRKRNTAASARFRIKKKMKEQQLERSVRELNELTITLEKKIQTLEMENKLLRNLVVEKGEQRNNNELEQLRQRAKLSSNSPFTEFGSNSPSSTNTGNTEKNTF